MALRVGWPPKGEQLRPVTLQPAASADCGSPLRGAAGGLWGCQTISRTHLPQLARRGISPPAKPAVAQPDNTFYFDTEFTSRAPRWSSNLTLSGLSLPQEERLGASGRPHLGAQGPL